MSNIPQPIQPEADISVLPGLSPRVFVEVIRDDGDIGYVQYDSATWDDLTRGLPELIRIYEEAKFALDDYKLKMDALAPHMADHPTMTVAEACARMRAQG